MAAIAYVHVTATLEPVRLRFLLNRWLWIWIVARNFFLIVVPALLVLGRLRHLIRERAAERS
jgi:hypothetical protein